MTPSPGKKNSGRYLVLALVALGVLASVGTWWNYTRFHPSAHEACLSKSDPPTVLAVFTRARFDTGQSYLATVTLHGIAKKFSAKTGPWKDIGNNRVSTEIILTGAPGMPVDTPCAVTLDLELHPTSD